MASSKEYLDSVLDQLSLAGGLARNREKDVAKWLEKNGVKK